MTTMTAFALRTDDTAWIERNHGTIGEAGRVFVQVPASRVIRHVFAGVPMLRHVFADVPADAVNAAIACPEVWVRDL